MSEREKLKNRRRLSWDAFRVAMGTSGLFGKRQCQSLARVATPIHNPLYLNLGPGPLAQRISLPERVR